MSEFVGIRALLTTGNGETLVARVLQDGDGPALQAFNAGLGEWTEAHFLPHAYDDATVAEYIRRSESGQDLTYVVLAGEQIVGYFFLWDVVEEIPVLGIGLADAYQGRGLGRQLMSILIEDARRSGRRGITLTTVLDNERAFALFTKMGFEYIQNVENMAGDCRIVSEREMFYPLDAQSRPHQRWHGPPDWEPIPPGEAPEA
jgi:ribosomal protein S18 acetylase RimI-like enzyme